MDIIVIMPARSALAMTNGRVRRISHGVEDDGELSGYRHLSLSIAASPRDAQPPAL
ncbi:hypothetical protein SM11_pC0314 (plasmid) [Sinorhizobium meliloti SM11]|uniref:Uncharacterized protein n=1 Tax=Sinorhizobium meliloti (strain SM11) TaxID=707241 RepID=F7XC96_SINMM|nr:hypothetical protein SM11_pC0314 [Sinorhizobium meliloti SM11]